MTACIEHVQLKLKTKKLLKVRSAVFVPVLNDPAHAGIKFMKDECPNMLYNMWHFGMQ